MSKLPKMVKLQVLYKKLEENNDSYGMWVSLVKEDDCGDTLRRSTLFSSDSAGYTNSGTNFPQIKSESNFSLPDREILHKLVVNKKYTSFCNDITPVLLAKYEAYKKAEESFIVLAEQCDALHNVINVRKLSHVQQPPNYNGEENIADHNRTLLHTPWNNSDISQSSDDSAICLQGE